MNRLILQGLRIKLDDVKGRWVEELSKVLWANQTIPLIPTNKSRFNLAFGIEVMILVKIGLPTMLIEHYNK